MSKAIVSLATAVLIATGSAVPALWVGHRLGAQRVQQKWDNATTQTAQATVTQQSSTRAHETEHADQLTEALDIHQAERESARPDDATRVADAVRLQHDAEARAARYRALSQASQAERDRLASHAARLDASLARGRIVAERLRATLVERDSQLQLLAAVIRADRALFPDGADNTPIATP